MTSEFNDRTGASVTISLDTQAPISSFVVRDAGGVVAGRADFVDAPDTDPGRIFFHTEVGPEFSGRGLAGLLVREALADTIRHGLIAVPVCPLFAEHLRQHGDEFLAAGGRFRQPTRADFAIVKRAVALDG